MTPCYGKSSSRQRTLILKVKEAMGSSTTKSPIAGSGRKMIVNKSSLAKCVVCIGRALRANLRTTQAKMECCTTKLLLRNCFMMLRIVYSFPCKNRSKVRTNVHFWENRSIVHKTFLCWLIRCHWELFYLKIRPKNVNPMKLRPLLIFYSGQDIILPKQELSVCL